MLGIIIAAHGDLSEAMKTASEMIFGKQPEVQTVSFEAHEDVAALESKFKSAMDHFDDQDQILFLVDLWGGSPFNAARKIVTQHIDKMALITGLNLSMLVEAYTMRDKDLSDVVIHLEETGRAGIKHLEIQPGTTEDEMP